MTISRRAFSSGALALAASARLGAATPSSRPTLTAALNSIRSYGEANLRHFSLPGMTLGLTAPNGFATALHFGTADTATRAPITPDTLFQIGSITKVMTALVIHQLAAEGRLGLGDLARNLAPDVKLPAN